MLYDPKWQHTKANPLSLEAFAAWLEKMPPHEKYDWNSCERCAIAQYLKSLGYAGAAAVPYDTYNIFEGGTGGAIALGHPWTFGAALDRARAVLTARQQSSGA